MRILVEQSGHALSNLGDWAMLRVTVRRLRSVFPGCQISVVGNAPDRIVDCIPGVQPLTVDSRSLTIGAGCLLGKWSSHAAEIDRKLVWAQPGWVLPLVRFRRKSERRGRAAVSEFAEAMHGADLVVAAGGGYITDEFPAMVKGVCGVLAVAHRLGKPTAMFGQGLGPLHHRELLKCARAGMTNLQMLTLREGVNSPAVAAELGIPQEQITVTGDDAVELAHALRPAAMGAMVGLNVRAAAYSGVATADLDHLRSAVQRILRDLASKPQSLPISFHDNEDNVSTSALLDQQGEPELSHLHEPEDVIRLAGQCRVVITGSYHAGVFALAQGIPVVGLAKSPYYLGKFAGLAAQFGNGCVCLNMSDRNFPEQLQATTIRLHATADRLRPALLERAEAQIAAGRNAYHRLSEMLCLA